MTSIFEKYACGPSGITLYYRWYVVGVLFWLVSTGLPWMYKHEVIGEIEWSAYALVAKKDLVVEQSGSQACTASYSLVLLMINTTV
jgi:hypothetical protein